MARPPVSELKYRDQRLDAAFVAKARTSDAGRALLAGNLLLDNRTWREVAEHHVYEWPAIYLWTNLNAQRVRWLLGPLCRLLGPAAPLPPLAVGELDDQIGGWLLRHQAMTEALARRASATRLPWLCAAVLRSEVSLASKLAALPHTVRAERLAFVLQPQCDGLDDDVVWQGASGPHRLPEAYVHSMLDDRLRSQELGFARQLLFLRPALVDRAIATGEVLWLLAAGAQALNADQQGLLCEAEMAVPPQDFEEYFRNLSPRDRPCGPVATLAAGPWCTSKTWAFVGDGHAWGCHLDGDRLMSTDPLGYRRHSLLRDRTLQPQANLATADPAVVTSWLHTVLVNPYPGCALVAASVLDRRDLGSRGARCRREAVRDHEEDLSAIWSRRPGVKPRPENETLHFCSAAVCAPAAGDDVDAAARPDERRTSQLGRAGTAWLGAQLSTWEIDLALTLVRDGYEGTAGELVALVRAIQGTPQASATSEPNVEEALAAAS